MSEFILPRMYGFLVAAFSAFVRRAKTGTCVVSMTVREIDGPSDPRMEEAGKSWQYIYVSGQTDAGYQFWAKGRMQYTVGDDSIVTLVVVSLYEYENANAFIEGTCSLFYDAERNFVVRKFMDFPKVRVKVGP